MNTIVKVTITLPDGELLETQTFAQLVTQAIDARHAAIKLAADILDTLELRFETVEPQ